MSEETIDAGGETANTESQSEGTVLTDEKGAVETNAEQTQEDQQDQPQKQGAEGEADEGGKEQDSDLEISFGDDFNPDQEILDSFKDIAKEIGLEQEAAQKLADFGPQIQQKVIDGIQEAHAQQLKEWAEQSKSDSEIGGAKFDENVAVAKKALDEFGSPELKEALNQSGMGNHPELIKFAYNIGQKISEGGVTPAGAVSGGQKSHAEILYPNHAN